MVKFFKQNSLSIMERKNRGFMMIEFIIGLAISVGMLAAFGTLIVQATKISRSNIDGLKAELYLRELVEISKDLEQTGWAELDACFAPGICYAQASGINWGLVAGSESLEDGKFTRWLSVEPVYRDSSDFPNQIVTAPGVLDPNTKKVTASINWNNGFGGQSMKLETFIYKMP